MRVNAVLYVILSICCLIHTMDAKIDLNMKQFINDTRLSSVKVGNAGTNNTRKIVSEDIDWSSTKNAGSINYVDGSTAPLKNNIKQHSFEDVIF
ncbi:hypothetical protein WDU94_010180 [Cyamophila willieti]